MLDDAGHGAVAITQDPSVPGGVGHPGGDHRHRTGIAGVLRVAGVLREHGAQRLAGQQRHVSVGDQHSATQPGRQRGQAAFGGPPSALDLVLIGDHRIRGNRRDVRGDLIPFVADHNREVVWGQPAGGHDRVPQQGTPADGVQDLRRDRLHSGALTCREDDDSGWAGAQANSPDSQHGLRPGFCGSRSERS